MGPAPAPDRRGVALARPPHDRGRAATLYGIITGYRDADQTPLWIAAAVPDPAGAHQVHSLRWRHASRGLAALEDAAAWIADVEIARRLVVAV